MKIRLTETRVFDIELTPELLQKLNITIPVDELRDKMEAEHECGETSSQENKALSNAAYDTTGSITQHDWKYIAE